jgi:hypothetical protein
MVLLDGLYQELYFPVFVLRSAQSPKTQNPGMSASSYLADFLSTKKRIVGFNASNFNGLQEQIRGSGGGLVRSNLIVTEYDGSRLDSGQRKT